jgi:hypothetical protein
MTNGTMLTWKFQTMAHDARWSSALKKKIYIHREGEGPDGFFALTVSITSAAALVVSGGWG